MRFYLKFGRELSVWVTRYRARLLPMLTGIILRPLLALLLAVKRSDVRSHNSSVIINLGDLASTNPSKDIRCVQQDPCENSRLRNIGLP
jgi:hypothetical protein